MVNKFELMFSNFFCAMMLNSVNPYYSEFVLANLPTHQHVFVTPTSKPMTLSCSFADMHR